MTPAALTIAVIAGAIGFGYFVYGRRQRRAMPFLSGLGLLAMPFLLESIVAMVTVAVVLAALPFVLRF